MKQTKSLLEAEARMRPGRQSLTGFLGDDPRALADVLAADAAAVSRLGATHERLAARLREVLDGGRAGQGDPVVLGDLEVTVLSFQGRAPCPFGHPGLHRKTEARVRHLPTGRELRYGDLSVHLVAVHGFYGGRGSPWRLEPSALVDLLGPPSGV